MTDVASLKNIGEKTATRLKGVGIHTAEELHELGAVKAWVKLQHTEYRLTLVGLYALQGAILGIHWNSVPEDMKAELREAVGL